MSHIIRASDSEYHYIYDELNRELYALKLLTIEEDINSFSRPKIKAFYMLTEYNYDVINGEVWVRDEANLQPAIFKVPIGDGRIIALEGTVRGGLHVSPIFLQYSNAGRLLSMKNNNMFIVRFTINDIVFYDGMDISVSKFIITHPFILRYNSVLNNAFIGLEYDYARIIEHHERLYSLIECESDNNELLEAIR